MTTTRTSVDAIRTTARDEYTTGREMGFSHDEAIERAVSATAMPTVTVKEWCEGRRRQADADEDGA